jgi:uncharacterized LabA/DUF88 family protein
LNLESFADGILRSDYAVQQIHYYTAHVRGREDPDTPRRQHAYLAALGTLPRVSIHFGSMRARKKRRPLVKPIPGYARVQEIHDTEEKGSDVNLGVHLVHHGHLNAYDAAAVITADTDLVEPMRIVRDELQLELILVYPDRGGASDEMRNAATATLHLHKSRKRGFRFPMAAYQFPETLPGTSIKKPASW